MTVYTPGSEAAISEIVAESARQGRKLTIRGGGTRTLSSSAPAARDTLSVERHSGITLYEPAALTIGAKAGTPLAQIEAALSGEGQHLPFEPADWRPLLGTSGEPTIGGAFACGVSGPRRIQAGALRDSAIGVRFVDGTGTIVKNGGRVMKNVTGYDLVKLMCGSRGTLGVVTEIVFKVLPRPETAATVILHGLDDGRAIEAMSAALGSPFDVTGAAHFPGEEPRTFLRLEGFEPSVAYRSGELVRLLSMFGQAQVAGREASLDLWRTVRDVLPFAGRAGAVWKISVRPSFAPALVLAIKASREAQGLYDWGGGLIWLLTPEDGDAGAALIRGALSGMGHATLMRAGNLSVPAFEPQAPAIEALSKNLRRQFDPQVILNPGAI